MKLTGPAFTDRPPAIETKPDVARVLLMAVGLAKTTCVGERVFPAQLRVPVPLCVRLPFTVTLESARVDGIVGVPVVGG